MYAMPPPMSRRSAIWTRLPMTASLSEVLAPPSTTTYGRGGSVVSWRSTEISATTSCPAACGSSWGRSYTLACLRCIAPNPSPTYSCARVASLAANPARSASSLLVSAGSKRTFSSSATSPSASPAAALAADSPATSLASTTSPPSSSDSRAATGRSDGPPAARSA